MWRKTSSVKDQFGDVHTRIMNKNYEAVPQLYFHTILILTFGLSLYTCERFVLVCAMAFFFTLPVEVIQATSNLVSTQIIYEVYMKKKHNLKLHGFHKKIHNYSNWIKAWIT